MATEKVSVGDLVARALALGSRVDTYWDVVHTLQRVGDQSVYTAARDLCRSSDEERQILGVDILSEFGREEGNPRAAEAVELVSDLVRRTQSSRVVGASLRALGLLGDESALPQVLRHAHDVSPEVRQQVARAIPSLAGNPEREEALEALIGLMSDPAADVRDWATFGLGSQLQSDSSKIRTALLERVEDEEGSVDGEALVGLALRQDERVAGKIVRRLERGDAGPLVVEAAATMPRRRFLPALYALQQDAWDRRNPRGEILLVAISVCESLP